MSLRIPQPAVFKNDGSKPAHAEIFDSDYTEANKSLPFSADLDLTAAVIVPELAFLPHAHPTNDASNVSSSNSLPVIDDGKSTVTDSSEGDTRVVLDRLKWRLASGFFAYFMCGWGDGVTGTVLPYFMADFHIGFMMSSLLYAATTVGFMGGTFLVESIVNRLGCFDSASTHFSWVPRIHFTSFISIRNQSNKKIGFSSSQARHVALLISSILHGMFFVMMGSRGGFWVAFGAYALAAFARSILTGEFQMRPTPTSADLMKSNSVIVIISRVFYLPLVNRGMVFRNAYFASGPQQSLGYAFGMWSLGSVASPLLCQSLIAINVPWFKFYFGSLVLSGINVAFLVLTFQPTEREFNRDRQNAFIVASKPEPETKWTKHVPSVKGIDVEYAQASDCLFETADANKKALSVALKLRYLWAVCVFTTLYYGCETSTQGFIVSYLLGTRSANPKTVGYVTSGFWGGITVGRFVWGHLTPKYVKHWNDSDFFYNAFLSSQGLITLSAKAQFKSALIGLTMQILIWTIDSNIENAISASVIGLVYGPVFPASLTLANDILPLEVRMISMALISASASFGSALFPFIAGTISSLEGVRTLTYITVPLAGTLACLWTLFPSKILLSQPGASA